MEANTIPTLPPEILELVIDSLGQEIKPRAFPAIKSFSTTCHTLLPICRRYLFAKVSLCGGEFPDDIRAKVFLDLISSTPHIAGSIIKLKFDCKLVLSVENDLHNSFCRAIKCINRLNRLRRLHLTGPSGSDWPGYKFDPGLLPVLAHLFELSSLTELRISGLYEIPFSMVQMWQGIRRLHVRAVNSLGKPTFSESVEPWTLPHLIPIQLFNYQTHNPYLVKEFFTVKRDNGFSALDLSSLRTLQFRDLILAKRILPYLLHHGACNLEVIIFRCAQRPDVTGYGHLLLCVLPTLKRIVLAFREIENSLEYIQQDIAVLSSSSSNTQNRIEAITIDVDIFNYATPFFGGLGDLLSNQSSWPALKFVYFDFKHFYESAASGLADWRNLAAVELAPLRLAGHLHYRCSHTLHGRALEKPLVQASE